MLDAIGGAVAVHAAVDAGAARRQGGRVVAAVTSFTEVLHAVSADSAAAGVESAGSRAGQGAPRTGRDIAATDAWDHVAGVTVGQDISDRALQFAAKPPHFDLGKSRDTYGPIGPLLVSPDLLADRDDLAITCDINGERRQTLLPVDRLL